MVVVVRRDIGRLRRIVCMFQVKDESRWHSRVFGCVGSYAGVVSGRKSAGCIAEVSSTIMAIVEQALSVPPCSTQPSATHLPNSGHCSA